jgi:TetR/AcrR family transcriptional repressor of nem operon
MGRTSDAKEKLLDVAFQLIWDSSYGSVSVDQICDRAKVNKGSFYHFYNSKADLAIAAYEEHWARQKAEMDRLFSVQVPPLDRLSAWCRFVYEGQKCKAANFGRVCGCPYASIGSELATQDDKIRAKSEEIMARNVRYLESAIVDARREGLTAIDDSKRAAQDIFAFVMGKLLQAKVKNDVELLKNLEATVMAIAEIKPVLAVSV